MRFRASRVRGGVEWLTSGALLTAGALELGLIDEPSDAPCRRRSSSPRAGGAAAPPPPLASERTERIQNVSPSCSPPSGASLRRRRGSCSGKIIDAIEAATTLPKE